MPVDEMPDWGKRFYTEARERDGSSGILPHHVERANSIERFCGPGKKRVLELGAGAGGTAAAIATLGYDVVAIELAVPPILDSQYRSFENEAAPGSLMFIEGDFYEVKVSGQFDVVGYWNGFGVGTDADQRRLLRRAAAEWLAPGGSLLLDVFNPWPWAQQHGLNTVVDTPQGPYTKSYRFDFVNCRFLDCLAPLSDPTNAALQSIRCYTPADFSTLVEGTGLTIARLEVSGRAIDELSQDTVAELLSVAWDYTAKLTLSI